MSKVFNPAISLTKIFLNLQTLFGFNSVNGLQKYFSVQKQRKSHIFQISTCSLFFNHNFFLCKGIPGNLIKILRLLVEFQLNFPSYSEPLLEMNCLVLKMYLRKSNFVLSFTIIWVRTYLFTSQILLEYVFLPFLTMHLLQLPRFLPQGENVVCW